MEDCLMCERKGWIPVFRVRTLMGAPYFTEELASCSCKFSKAFCTVEQKEFTDEKGKRGFRREKVIHSVSYKSIFGDEMQFPWNLNFAHHRYPEITYHEVYMLYVLHNTKAIQANGKIALDRTTKILEAHYGKPWEQMNVQREPKETRRYWDT